MSQTTGRLSPVMERWVHEKNFLGSSQQQKPTRRRSIAVVPTQRSHVTFHDKTKASPSQTGHKARLRMVSGGSRVMGARTTNNDARNGTATTPRGMSPQYSGKSWPNAPVVEGSSHAPSSPRDRTHSPRRAIVSPSQGQEGLTRRQTTLAEFGRTLMASKRLFPSVGTEPAPQSTTSSPTPNANPQHKSESAQSPQRRNSELSAASSSSTDTPAHTLSAQESPVHRHGSILGLDDSPTNRSAITSRVSLSSAKDDSFGTDMAIKIVQHHKDVTPTGKLATGLRRIAGTGRVPLVLVAFGALNPVHLNHLRMFQTARAFIERNTEFGVIGGYLCPAHDKYVRSKCRADSSQAIPAKHRVRLCQLMVQDSSWIDCNRWEVTRNTGFLDYPTVLEHCHAYMLGTLGPSVRTMYVCGIDELAKLAPDVLQNYGAICVCRFSDDRAVKEARKIRRRSGGQVYVAEDHDIIHTALATASSTKVRKLLMQNGPTTELLGPKCVRYAKSHHIGQKLAGLSKWTKADRDIESLFGNDEEVEKFRDTVQYEPSGRGLYETTGGSSIRRISVKTSSGASRKVKPDKLVEHAYNKLIHAQGAS